MSPEDKKMENKTMMQYFEWYLPDNGLFWKRVGAQAEALKRAGIHMLWLPPAYKGMQTSDVGYGVYDLYDLGEFDQKGNVRTKYGTKKEYIDAIKKLHKAGIEVLADLVFNHKMGADASETVRAIPANYYNRQETSGEPITIKAWTRFDFPGRGGKYSDFIWNHTHFSGTDWDEERGKKDLYLFEGKCWNRDTDDEFGNFDYLMGADLDTDNREVRDELRRFGKWYVKETMPDGFRLDAVKHISAEFYRDYLAYMRKETHKELFAVGEYWHADLGHLTGYLDAVDHSMSLFDVPLHYNFFQASNQSGSFDMRYLFANTLVGARAENAVTFVDNHDTQPGQSLSSFVNDWFKPIAYASILLRQGGLPCVFYGDFYGLPSCGKPPVQKLPVMLKVRELYAYGKQIDYFDHENIIGWVRCGDKEHPGSGIAVVLSDGPGGSRKMDMGIQFAGQWFYDVTGKCQEPVCLSETGTGEFYVDGGTVSVWVTKQAYEKLFVDLCI